MAKYEIKSQRLFPGDPNALSEGNVLNIIVRHTHRGWELEGDPRHVELLPEHLGINGRGATTPGTSEEEKATGSVDDPGDEDGAVELEGPEVSAYRAMAARCNYI